ncbi:hypothetical protein EYF80_040152 [Liparis tanakae]|uniref:Uncharacterized protein n=1 Tax=Liparis tanakae TaxID=230148 RepID=A0A4Z2G9D0_9TELE|nr:hypothetical protein EYF80_040152 [Liparis tanakae]
MSSSSKKKREHAGDVSGPDSRRLTPPASAGYGNCRESPPSRLPRLVHSPDSRYSPMTGVAPGR